MSTSDPLREPTDAGQNGPRSDFGQPARPERARSGVAAELARADRFDQAIRAAMHDVPVPSGLAERLVEAAAQRDRSICELRVLASAPLIAPVAAESPAVGSASLAVSVLPPRLSRRAWTRAALAMTGLAAAGLLSFWLWPRPPRVVTAHELAESFPSWIDASARGSALRELPRGFGFPSAVAGRPRGYKRFQTSQGWNGIAIDLATAGNPPATLLVIRSPARFMIPATPLRITATAGNAAAAWQVQDLLYVLVVEERGQRLEDFLGPVRQA